MRSIPSADKRKAVERAHHAVIKACVQAKLPAMSHLTNLEQDTLVLLLYEKELERRKAAFPSQNSALRKLERRISVLPFSKAWHIGL